MKEKTVKQWILQYIGLLLIPPFLVIAVLFFYMISSMSNRSVELSQRTMQLYVSQMEESINNMERILVTLYDNNIDLSYLCVSEDINQLYLHKTAYSRYLEQEMLIFNRFDGMFTLVEREHERIYIDAGNTDRDVIKEAFLGLTEKESLLELISTNKWFVYEMGDQYYLMRVVRNGKNYCGAWICLNPLAEQVKESCGIDLSEAVVLDERGNVASCTADKMKEFIPEYGENEHILMGEKGRRYAVGTVDMFDGLLHFFLFMPTKGILKEVNILWGVWGVILFFVAVLLMIFWRKMQSKIIAPCVELSDAMARIETEELLPVSTDVLREFGQMQQGFNQMKEQIYALKIRQYEQQLREQKIHMEYLFGQMQPHFFLNTLNVLYSFAEIERYDLIQKMVLTMVKYLRYIFNNGSKPVALREELSHVEDFITIQQIRYPNRFSFRKEIEKGLEEIDILPFLLQTFVENSIKYGLNQEQMSEIYIGVFLQEKEIRITIADTGKGFSEEQIHEINENTESQDVVYKVGIRNTRQRLELMYGKGAGITVGNRPEGGAVVNITFPCGETGESRNESTDCG